MVLYIKIHAESIILGIKDLIEIGVIVALKTHNLAQVDTESSGTQLVCLVFMQYTCISIIGNSSILFNLFTSSVFHGAR